MNKERMLVLADELENPSRLPINFNMRDFIDVGPGKCYSDVVSREVKFDCGTTACIGGHACLMFGEKGTLINEASAKSLLDLTQDQTDRLFYNSDKYIVKNVDFEDITREQAAAAIYRMVAKEG